jgi:serine/threonine-protein kinase
MGLQYASTMSVPGAFPESLEARFEVLELLGQGGFGRVVLARDRQLDRQVAIKIHMMAADVPDAVERFLQEARVTARIEAPEVVRIYDHGVEPGGEAWIVYEYIQGESLAARLARKVRLPVDVCIDWGKRVALALQEVHDRGVVHRDIKPANVMIRTGAGEEAPVLCDFGLAWTGRNRKVVTQEGLVLGTPAYMPPEVLFGGSPSPAGDQYAWAAVLYEMVFGRKLQPDNDPSSVVESHRLGKRPDYRAPDVAAPDFLVNALDRALERDPEKRFADMAALARALEPRSTRTRVTHRPGAAEPAATVAMDSRVLRSRGHPREPARTPRGRVTAGLAVLVAGSVALGLLWPDGKPEEPPTPVSPREVVDPQEVEARAGAERTLEDLLRFLDEGALAAGPTATYKSNAYIRARLRQFADPFYGTKFQRYADALVAWAPLANARIEGRVALGLHRLWLDHLVFMYEGAFERAEVPTDILQWGPQEEILPLLSKIVRGWTDQKERLRDLVVRLREAVPEPGLEVLELVAVAAVRCDSQLLEPLLRDMMGAAEVAETKAEGLVIANRVADLCNSKGASRVLKCRFRREVLRVVARRHANANHAPSDLPGALNYLGNLVHSTFLNCPRELGESELAAVDEVLDQAEAQLDAILESALRNFVSRYSDHARPPSNTLAVRLERVEALLAKLASQ